MKKILFFPLLFLALFTITSCNDDDDDTPTPVYTETQQMLFGNWRMHAFNEDYFNDNDEVMHNYSQQELNNLFEYKEDGTMRFKGEEDPNWGTRKYDVSESGNERTLNVYNAAGTQIETAYKIEKLTATEMVLVDAYDYGSYKDADGNDVTSRRVVKTYEYSKL